MFRLKFTIQLLLILMIPFILREMYGHNAELFPAVMLPSGAIKVPVGIHETSVKEINIYAQKSSGEWEKVNTAVFLSPIPTQYHKAILSKEFGVKKTDIKNLNPSNFIAQLKNRLKSREASDLEKDSIKIWLKNKLEKQGFMGSMIKIVHTTTKRDMSNNSQQSQRNTYENIICLDRCDQ
jgi:hypothetical protein